MSVGLCQSAAKGKGKKEKNKNTNTNKNKKNKFMKVTKIRFLGVRNFVFFFFRVFLVFCFCFLGVLFFLSFLVSWFLVFWFVVGFLKGWQNNTKAKDLDLTLCQFSHFRGANLFLVDFIGCFGPVVPLKQQCKKTMAKCRYHWRKLGGLGHRLGNFVCLCNFSKTVLNKCKNIGSQ